MRISCCKTGSQGYDSLWRPSQMLRAEVIQQEVERGSTMNLRTQGLGCCRHRTDETQTLMPTLFDDSIDACRGRSIRHARLVVALFVAFLVACERKPESANSGPEPAGGATPKSLTVFAAASTTNVIQEIADRFEAAHGVKIKCSFAASSTLAQQIKAGAPADIFISADQPWMDDVEAAGAIQSDSREDLLGNHLVMIAPAGKPFKVTMSREFDFAASLPEVRRIAVGDPTHVPAGRYAQQALQRLGWWTGVEPRLITAENARAAVRLVEIGEADAGIVYSTDARSTSKVIAIGQFPAESHEPIRYPVALCRNASADAAKFMAFLRSPEAAGVFEKAGFIVLPPRSGGGGTR